MVARGLLSTISGVRTVAGGREESGEALLRRMAARRRRDNVVVGVLSVLAVLGGGHAIFSVFSSDPPPPGDDAAVAIVGHAQLAESFAQEFVVTYLSASSGEQERLAAFVGGNQQITLPKSAQQVSDPVVVYAARSLANGNLDVWTVTVSVRVGKEASATTPRQYYRVAISVAEGRLRALTLPAAVEPPGRGADLAQAYSSPCAEDTPLAQVARGFLAAYLTGSGDVSRYTSLDAGIAALHPAPFSALSTVTITADNSSCGTSGTTARILANTNPKSDSGAAPSLAYPLTMVRTEGQWQVRSIDALPALKEPLTVVQESQGPESQASGTTAPPTTTVPIPPATQN